jgi:hypothetical protein
MLKNQLLFFIAALLAAPMTVQATDWTISSNTCGAALNAPCTFGSATATAYQTSTSVVTSTFVKADPNYYDPNGVGILSSGETGTSPNHAIDNSGPDEFLELLFTDMVKLSSFVIGWNNGGDADITIYAHTGAAASPADLTGQSFTSLLTQGWELIGNYANVATYTTTNITGNKQANRWIIAAYNGATVGNLTPGNDYFKLKTVSGSIIPPTSGSSVPEPSGLMLLTLGILGWRLTKKYQIGRIDLSKQGGLQA